MGAATRSIPGRQNASAAPRPRRDWGQVAWTGAVVALFLALPMLKLELSRVTLYDGLILGLLGALVLNQLVGSGRRQGVARWRPRGPARFYAWHGAMLVVALLSGLNVTQLVPWGIELATFVYMLLMILTIDSLVGHRIEHTVRIAGFAFAGLMLIAGTGALLGVTGIAHLSLLYASQGGVQSDKFSGFARAANQWAAYVVAFHPVVIAMAMKERRPLLRAGLIAAAALGFFTLLASGSRTGLLLGSAQTLVFLGVFLFINRSMSAARKTLIFMAFVVTAALMGWFINAYTSDNWVVQRALGSFDTLEGRGESLSTDWRAKNFAWAFEQIELHPVFGVGVGCFATLYDRHEVHSTYLSLWAEGGIFMLLSWVGLLLTTLYRQTLALLQTIRLKQDNLLLIGFMAAVLSQVLFGFTHNTTRTRSTALIVWMGLIWAEHVLVQLRSVQAAPRAEARTLALLRRPGGSAGRSPASPR
jgi:O-antigen ligase